MTSLSLSGISLFLLILYLHSNVSPASADAIRGRKPLGSITNSARSRSPLGRLGSLFGGRKKTTAQRNPLKSKSAPKRKPRARIMAAAKYRGGVKIPLRIWVMKGHSVGVQSRVILELKPMGSNGMKREGFGAAPNDDLGEIGSADSLGNSQESSKSPGSLQDPAKSPQRLHDSSESLESFHELEDSSGSPPEPFRFSLNPTKPPESSTPTPKPSQPLESQPNPVNASLNLYTSAKAYNQMLALDSHFYGMNLGIGTPVKNIKAIIDTGSSDIVIARKEDGCVPGDGYYCSADSETFEDVSDLEQTFNYGTVRVRGSYVRDKMHVGHAPNAVYIRRRVQFFAGTQWRGLNPDPNREQRGIVGLAPRRGQQVGSHLMWELQHNGNMIRTMSGFRNVFTTLLEDCDAGRLNPPVHPQQAGHIVLGAFDDANCNRQPLTTVEIEPETNQFGIQSIEHWTFRVQAMRVVRPPLPRRSQSQSRSRHRATAPETPPQERVDNVVGEFMTMSDSGATAMYFTEDILNVLMPILEAVPHNHHGQDMYLISCRKPFSLEFLVNGVWLRVVSGHLVKRFDPNWCYLKINVSSMNGLSVFGQAFGISYCQFHRGDEERLEIMQRRHPATIPPL